MPLHLVNPQAQKKPWKRAFIDKNKEFYRKRKGNSGAFWSLEIKNIVLTIQNVLSGNEGTLL